MTSEKLHVLTTTNAERNLRTLADELEDTTLIGRLSGSSHRNFGLSTFFLLSYHHFDLQKSGSP